MPAGRVLPELQCARTVHDEDMNTITEPSSTAAAAGLLTAGREAEEHERDVDDEEETNDYAADPASERGAVDEEDPSQAADEGVNVNSAHSQQEDE